MDRASHSPAVLAAALALITLAGSAAAGPPPQPELLKDFPGIEFNGLIPPNPQIAAGPEHLVLATNGRFEVRDKDDNVLTVTSLEDFFSPVTSPGDFLTDPRLLFDSGRFFLCVASRREQPFASYFLLAVSETSDPSGPWRHFALDASLDNSFPTANFADLPSLGVDDNAVYLTANMFDSNTLTFQVPGCPSFPRRRCSMAATSPSTIFPRCKPAVVWCRTCKPRTP